MKKNYLFLALAAAALGLASCASDDAIGNNGNDEPTTGKVITFSSGTKAFTRSDLTSSDAATKLQNEFVVYGRKVVSGSSSDVYKNYRVQWVTGSANTTVTNSSNWEYVGITPYNSGQTTPTIFGISNQTVKYWDYSAEKYVFTAVASKDDITNGKVAVSKTDGVDATAGYTLTLAGANLDNLYISDRNEITKGTYDNTVQMKFRQPFAKIRVGIYETIPGYEAKILGYYVDETNDAPAFGTMSVNKTDKFSANFVNTAVKNSETMTITYFADGAYKNQPKISVATSSAKVLTLGDGLKADALIGTSSNTPTWDNNGDYTKVFNKEANNETLKLKVSYKLISTDGSGEVITVNYATAEVPAEYLQWKNNYTYTYLFKISDKTNGYTGGTTDAAGLYPITFDAVVVNTEDGIQETITTVEATSITTYQEGAKVSNDEYVAGNVYVSALLSDGTTTGDLDLYEATLKSGSTSSITEATAKLAFEQGVGADNKYSKTDVTLERKDDLKVTVTSVPGIDATINALRFNAAAGKTYVVRYGDFYKVIKIKNS